MISRNMDSYYGCPHESNNDVMQTVVLRDIGIPIHPMSPCFTHISSSSLRMKICDIPPDAWVYGCFIGKGIAFLLGRRAPLGFKDLKGEWVDFSEAERDDIYKSLKKDKQFLIFRVLHPNEVKYLTSTVCDHHTPFDKDWAGL